MRLDANPASADLRTQLAALDPTEATPPPADQGWNDRQRGVNRNLGDTESALQLFYQRHPSLQGRPPTDGTPEADELKDLHLWADSQRLGRTPDPAETHWSDANDDRAITVTKADRETAHQIYFQQHPELNGRAPKAGSALDQQLQTLTKNVAQNRYNATIDQAVRRYPTEGVDAKTLKSLLVEESGLNPNVGTNSAGYTGIAQLGPDLASTSVANDPLQAIPLAAKALKGKAAYLDGVFPKYGTPTPRGAHEVRHRRLQRRRRARSRTRWRAPLQAGLQGSHGAPSLRRGRQATCRAARADVEQPRQPDLGSGLLADLSGGSVLLGQGRQVSGEITSYVADITARADQ